MSDTAMTVVYRAAGRPEAEVVRGRLASAGIKAMVHCDDAGWTDPALGFVQGAQVMVFERDADRAERVLRGH